MTVKVRFAPSPTGYLHIGNARAAIVTWLFARNQNGHFLLRIDDTDQQRSKKEYEQDIENSLQWLGLNWDEKANQLPRMAHYHSVIEKLKAAGRLYACYETPEELSLKRKTQLSRGKPPIYDRAALDLTEDQIKSYENQGRQPHWRFKLNHKPIEWTDLIRGPVKFEGSDLSDPVVIREDGSPLYHLCSVIDDFDYGITHVTRGEDHISNTAAHIQMFEAVGNVMDRAHTPTFAHWPLISDKEGGKLSKRLGSLSIKDLKETEGLEPLSIISLMARLGTSDPIEPFTSMDPVIKNFDFAKFSRGTPKFDPEDLSRLNAKILHETSYDAIKDRLVGMDLETLDEQFWNSVKRNLEKLSDIKNWWQVAHGPVTPDIEDPAFLETALDLLPPAPWTEDTFKEWTDKIKEETGRKGKALFMPLRKALTGMKHGPELPVLLPLIGPEKVRQRLQAKKAA